MGFAKTGWSNPMPQEDALEAICFAELEAIARQHVIDLRELVARFEKERALCLARYELARERLWGRDVCHRSVGASS